jgi:CMP-N-acetylneuraminic acid synthetase
VLKSQLKLKPGKKTDFEMKRDLQRLCSVCVRGGSKGVPNKNIRPLLGKPLLFHSLDQAKESGLFDCIVVSSDSKLILQMAAEWGVDHTIERPEELATDFAPKLPVIQHCFQTAEILSGLTFETVVDLDATSPLRNKDDLIGVVNLLENHDSTTNVITGAPARRSPYFNLVELDEAGRVHKSGMKKRWREMLINPEASLQETLDILECVGQIVFVVDSTQHLLGTVTDHDVRTALSKGFTIESSVKNIMNSHPTIATEQMDEDELWEIFHESGLLHIPVLNAKKRLINVRNMSTIVRRQDAPPCYDCNASIYAWWRDSLLKARNVIQSSTQLYVMPEERSVDIDSELDFRWVEFLMNEQLKVCNGK